MAYKALYGSGPFLFYLSIFICHFNLPVPLQPHWPCCCFNTPKSCPAWELLLFPLPGILFCRTLPDLLPCQMPSLQRNMFYTLALLYFLQSTYRQLIVYLFIICLCHQKLHLYRKRLCLIQCLFLSYCRPSINICSIKGKNEYSETAFHESLSFAYSFLVPFPPHPPTPSFFYSILVFQSLISFFVSMSGKLLYWEVYR